MTTPLIVAKVINNAIIPQKDAAEAAILPVSASEPDLQVYKDFNIQGLQPVFCISRYFAPHRKNALVRSSFTEKPQSASTFLTY